MKRFGLHSNSRCSDEIKDLMISIDFQTKKHGVVTPVFYYIFMLDFRLLWSLISRLKVTTIPS